MLSPTRIGLAMLSCQRLTGEVRQHLPGRALLPPRPLLNSEEDVIIQANCGAHARDANAYSGTPILEPAASGPEQTLLLGSKVVFTRDRESGRVLPDAVALAG